MESLLDWDGICYSEVFEIAYYESEFNIEKSKVVDPISQIKMQKDHFMGMKLRGTWGSLRSLITNSSLKFGN